MILAIKNSIVENCNNLEIERKKNFSEGNDLILMDNIDTFVNCLTTLGT